MLPTATSSSSAIRCRPYPRPPPAPPRRTQVRWCSIAVRSLSSHVTHSMRCTLLYCCNEKRRTNHIYTWRTTTTQLHHYARELQQCSCKKIPSLSTNPALRQKDPPTLYSSIGSCRGSEGTGCIYTFRIHACTKPPSYSLRLSASTPTSYVVT